MFAGGGSADIQHGQHHKNISLDQRNKYVQSHEDRGEPKESQAEKHHGDLLTRAYIFANRRIVSDMGRAKWLMISMGIIIGASHHNGPAKCLR